MNKIFGIGLPKTGTWSLCAAINSLGFKSLHYIDPGNFDFYISVIEKYEFINDCPINYIFEDLSLQYPNSKFICTTRNFESWIKSSKNFFKKTKSNNSIQHLNKLFKINLFNYEKFKETYENHSKKVFDFSKKNSVLYLPLEYDDKLKLICDFLKIKSQKTKYPWINKKKIKFI